MKERKAYLRCARVRVGIELPNGEVEILQQPPTKFETTILVLPVVRESRPATLVPVSILPAKADTHCGDGPAKDLTVLDNVPLDDPIKESAGYRKSKAHRSISMH